MVSGLPEYLDGRLWTAGKPLVAAVPASALRRVSAPFRTVGNYAVDLHPVTDEFGRRWLKGTISGSVRGICQRCLEDAEIPVKAQVDYACVKSEAQGREFEPDHDYLLMTDEDKVPLLDLIEDEILLALPMIPRHSEEDCAPANVAEAAPVVEETDRKPFADLADLLKKQE